MAPHSADLARAAEVIGRRFDAKAWWRLAVRRDPANEKEAAAALERMARIESSPGPAPEGRTLAELLGPTGPRPAATNTSVEGADHPHLRRRGRAAGHLLPLRERPDRAPPAPRDHGLRSGDPGLRRRWMARYLRHPGGTISPRRIGPAGRGGSRQGRPCRGVRERRASARSPGPDGRPAVPQPGRRHDSRTRRPPRAWPACRAATATGWRWATTTTTAGPTCSSPDGGRMPCIATGARARSRT